MAYKYSFSTPKRTFKAKLFWIRFFEKNQLYLCLLRFGENLSCSKCRLLILAQRVEPRQILILILFMMLPFQHTHYHFNWMPPCFLASLPSCLLASLLASLLACLLSCLPSCQLACHTLSPSHSSQLNCTVWKLLQSLNQESTRTDRQTDGQISKISYSWAPVGAKNSSLLDLKSVHIIWIEARA